MMIFWTAFTLGLMGSTHCVGMCGPIAMALPGEEHRLWRMIQYNLGRLTTYVLLGLLMGILGTAVSFSGYQSIFSIAMGIVLLIAAFLAGNLEAKWLVNGWLSGFYQWIQRRISRLFQSKQLPSHLAIGFFNGFLPCGLVYFALAGALTMPNLASGMLFMLFFGLGTFPLMLLAGVAKNAIPMHWRMRLRKLVPVFLAGFAILLVLRGVGVEVPEELVFWEAINNPTFCH
ncbi:MAG: sulfite exporter TauE/SafE family protein [Bacteroidota bacterium]